MSNDGKVAIVTGAARGLGAAFSTELAGAGCIVVACDLRDRGFTEALRP